MRPWSGRCRRGGLVVVVAEVAEDRPEHVDDVLVVRSVEAVPAVPADGDHPKVPENAELLRHPARREAGQPGELVDGPLALQQRVENPQSARGGERGHHLGKGMSLFIGHGRA